MGPKVKKAPKTAYTFFMEDYVKSERQRGRDVSMRVAQEECAPMWRGLTAEEKKPYSDRAGAYKEKARTDLHNKFTTGGKSYAEVKKEDDAKDRKEKNMLNEIERTIRSLNTKRDLANKYFHFIHVNFYCHTTPGFYYIAEIAVCVFNLDNGMIRHYTTIVNPGPLPCGYSSEANERFKNEHGIPEPSETSQGERDFINIYDNICDVLKEGHAVAGRLPPLYAFKKCLPEVEQFVRYIEHVSNFGRHEPFDNAGNLHDQTNSELRVFRAEELFYSLRNKCALMQGINGFPTRQIAEVIIEKDKFRHTANLCCDFHKDIDGKEHSCSLSVIRRYIFQFCDYLCKDIDVPLIPGTHVPINADIDHLETIKSRNSSRASSAASWRGRRDVHEMDYVSEEASQVTSAVTSRAEPNYNRLQPNRSFQQKPSYSDWGETASSLPQSSVPLMDNNNFPSLGGGRWSGPIKHRIAHEDDDDDDDESIPASENTYRNISVRSQHETAHSGFQEDEYPTISGRRPYAQSEVTERFSNLNVSERSSSQVTRGGRGRGRGWTKLN